MKLSEKLQAALNKQVNLELHAAYTYKGMEQYFREEGYPQFAHFFGEHTKEELKHANDFKHFIEEVDGHVVFLPIEGAATEYASIKAALDAAMDHEKMISASIISILEIAIAEKHYAAENFLRGYVDEQVEEEDLFRSLIGAVEHAGERGASPFALGQILQHNHED